MKKLSTSFVIYLFLGVPVKAVELFDPAKTYATPNTVVRYAMMDGETGRYLVGNFKNKWYTTGDTKPKPYPNDGAWIAVSKIISVTNDPGKDLVTGDVHLPRYHTDGSYPGGVIILGLSGQCYQAQWWTREDPEMNGAGWELINCPEPSQATLAAISEDGGGDGSGDGGGDGGGEQPQPKCGDGAGIPTWSPEGTYTEGSVVTHHSDQYYVAKWWNQEEPPAEDPVTPWSSPWLAKGSCAPVLSASGGATVDVDSEDSDTDLPSGVIPAPVIVENDTDDAAKEATDQAGQTTDTTITPAIPAAIPGAPEETSIPITTPAADSLPAEGYAFLRLVTEENWDWMFPLRSGKLVSKTPCAAGQFQNCGGGERNDGSNDAFTLAAFIKAVLEYNNWANVNGYKQFLNEGTQKQQAQEFIAFWAKSSRETSGSWGTAKEPWIVKHIIDGEDVWGWKGGLYWVEEVGYSTDPTTGKSKAVNYVDLGSTEYPPAPGRSYYGRGVIQLSWNYNYGAFSYWLFDNGLFNGVITERDILLRFPNLVADNGALSILSGIWFWMTPQGAKPSSHDVIVGDIFNVSTSTQDPGLPQSNTLSNDDIPRGAGDTSNQNIHAYRLGTITNIVNGGLECNKAANWHGGPVQRGFYYDLYSAYFNDQYSVGVTRIDDAKASTKDAWLTKVTDSSPLNLQSVTCYNQKSYYGW